MCHSIFYHWKSPLSVNSWFSFSPSLQLNVFLLKMREKKRKKTNKFCETFSILKRLKLKALEANEIYHKASFIFLFFLKILFIYLCETQREVRDIGRGRRLFPGSPRWDSIPEFWDHALSQRQTCNRSATQASPQSLF